MSYPEYTECTAADTAKGYQQNSGMPWGNMIAWAFVGTFVNFTAVVIIAALVGQAKSAILTGPLLITPLVGLLTGLVAYCDWWLNYRLICLDDDKNRCVIGFVAEVGDPRYKDSGGSFIEQLEAFFDKFDTDFTLNIGIMHTWFGDKDLDLASKAQPFGYLLKSAADNQVLQAGFTLEGTHAPATEGVYAQYGPYAGQSPMQALHVEFEGGGVHTLRDWLKALILLLLAAEALAAACAGGLVWACALLIVLAVVLPFLIPVGIAHSTSKQANPGDIDKALASLSLGDIVLVSGRWIYDSAHSGWNEIHPVRHCQILKEGVFDGNWASVFPFDPDEWCAIVASIDTPDVKTAQKDAVNTWVIHPQIDGCVSPYVPPDAGPRIENVSNVSSYSNCYNDYKVTASVSDPSGIAKVELFYRFSSGSWETEPMVLKSSTTLYEAVIQLSGTMTYFVRAYSATGDQTDSAQYSTFLYCVA